MSIQHEDEEMLAPLLREHYTRELGATPTGMQLWNGIEERIVAETHSVHTAFSADKSLRNSDSPILDPPRLNGNHAGRTGGRWRALAAVLAASLVVAMSVAVFSLAAPRHGASAPKSPTVAATPAIALDPAALIPSGTLIAQIQMLSPTDGWAVGSKDFQNTALVLHYSAGQWHVAATFPGGRLEHLTMLSPSDGWAAGIMMSDAGGGHTHPSLLAHYTGGQWVQAPPPLPDTEDFHMLTPDTGYLVGAGLDVAGTGPQDHLAIYDHGDWHEVPLPTDLFPITLSSLTEGWASDDNGQLWHFHNGTWRASGQSLPASLRSDMQMLSATEGWAAGFHQVGQVTTKNVTASGWPYLAHYDGATWQAVIPNGLPANSMLDHLSMESSDAGWAWGAQNNTVPALLLDYSSGRWSVVPLPKQVFGLDTISSASPTELWAAGDDFGATGIASMLLHEKDGIWTIYVL